MAEVIPFKAVRPTRAKVGLVATRSYTTYTPEMRQQKLETNPYSFLHILTPGFKYGLEVDGLFRFKLVNNRYREFKENGILQQDASPCYYIYRQKREGMEFTGIIAGTSIQDYRSGVIQIHEQTLTKRENIFKDYLKFAGFNSEPVLMMYPKHKRIDEIIAKYVRTRPEYEFATTNKFEHYLWLIDQPEDIESIRKSFEERERLFIADGHHRSASSVLLGEEINQEQGRQNGAHNYFMSYLISDSEVKSFEFNRLVKDLNGLSKEEFLMYLDHDFRIEEKGITPYKPTNSHHFSMYLDDKYYALYLRKDDFNPEHPIEELDPYILNELVLRPILGIEDPKTDKRLSYLSGLTDPAVIRGKVDEGKFAVSFGMKPVSVDQIIKLTLAGESMPPKSTYLEPKLRSGLLNYEIFPKAQYQPVFNKKDKCTQ